MVITMEIIKKYFGEIDLTDETLVKKTFKELAKKLHPDNLSTGDEEKFKELKSCYKRIDEIRPELIVMNDIISHKKEELENTLKNLERDLTKFRKENDEILDDIKIISQELTSLKNMLKESFLYLLFNTKSKKRKLINFLALVLTILTSSYMLMDILKFNTSAIIVTTTFVISAFIFLFRKNMSKINLAKKLILKYEKEKEELDYASSRLERRITSWEIKKHVVAKKINALEEEFKIVS